MQGAPHLFLINRSLKTKGLSLLLPDKLLYFLALHVKFSSSAQSSQLVEIFAYENPTPSVLNYECARAPGTVLVYQFHNLFTQERLFVFVSSIGRETLATPKSLGELFSCSAWLEREVGEMHGTCFEGKKDLRNLMLQYADASNPFKKAYPSVGVKELFYDSVTDTLVQVPVSMQL